MSKKIEIVIAKRLEDCIEYAKCGIDSYFRLNGYGSSYGAGVGERALSYSFLMDTLRKVMGKTLTIIDASVMDKTQNKAIKDLLRNVFSDEMEFSAEMAFDQELTTKLADESFAALSEEEKKEAMKGVSIEEALGVE